MWSFWLKLKHKFPKIADDTLYFTLSSFNTDDIVISALSSFKTMTTFKLCSHLSAKMTSSKWRCYLFHRWQRIFCHLYSSMKDDNAENGVSSFKDHNVNYALSSFITDDVVIKTLSSAWQITTQKIESHLSKITTWNMAFHLLLQMMLWYRCCHLHERSQRRKWSLIFQRSQREICLVIFS